MCAGTVRHTAGVRINDPDPCCVPLSTAGGGVGLPPSEVGHGIPNRPSDQDPVRPITGTSEASQLVFGGAEPVCCLGRCAAWAGVRNRCSSLPVISVGLVANAGIGTESDRLEPQWGPRSRRPRRRQRCASAEFRCRPSHRFRCARPRALGHLGKGRDVLGHPVPGLDPIPGWLGVGPLPCGVLGASVDEHDGLENSGHAIGHMDEFRGVCEVPSKVTVFKLTVLRFMVVLPIGCWPPSAAVWASGT